ncbi:hypothetical protein [Gluconobacter oxydans]|uniref:hypothetical protein n=1 Tax=Gluconobacter oxydans TaxID=442 RepID=UPI0012DAD5A7|nr:hypothetical protein [Gluconobacter oxydans]MCP1247937.1 hypothetical protein [Gluconobacter oxydans]WKE47890.1 hypothetical protein NUJ38_11340 [Gluconobacter oxydans]
MTVRKTLLSLALFTSLVAQTACSGDLVLEKRLTPADTLRETTNRTVVPGTFVMTVKSVNVFNKMVLNRKILVIGSAMKVGADLEQGIIVNNKDDYRTYIFVSRASNIFLR